MLTEKDFDLIQAYLDDALLGQDRVLFQQRLVIEPELKHAVEEQQNMLNVLKASHQQTLRATIEKNIPATAPVSKEKHIPVPWRYGAVAAVVLLVGLTALLLHYNQDPYAAVFDTHFEVYPMESLQRSPSNGLAQGLKLYAKQSYEASIPFLIPFGDDGNSNNTYNLAIGSAYLKVGDPEKAIHWFKPNLKANDPLTRQHAEWYHALAQLKRSPEHAKSYFEAMAQSATPYKDRAAKILNVITP